MFLRVISKIKRLNDIQKIENAYNRVSGGLIDRILRQDRKVEAEIGPGLSEVKSRKDLEQNPRDSFSDKKSLE